MLCLENLFNMAERMKSLAKRSGSKLTLGKPKSSVNHIGAAPITYKIDIFISYVDAIKSSGEFCVTWERRGKSLATATVKVKDSKAVFRESLSMDTTLFRKSSPKDKDKGAGADGNFKFDEKIAKFALRKGNADGKAIGKMHLNLADHVKGTTGTVFADLKLSNGSIVVTKIESTLLHMGRKAKTGGDGADSEMCSEMSEIDTGMENDSIFGDDAADMDDLGDLDLMSGDDRGGGKADGPPSKAVKAPKAEKVLKSSKKSSKDEEKDDSEPPKSVKKNKLIKMASSAVGADDPGKESKQTKKSKMKEGGEGLTESPSLRDKVKLKIKKDKASGKKEKGGAEESPKVSSKDSLKQTAEVNELRTAMMALTADNKRLQTSRQAMMQEIDELRTELESCEQALEEASGEGQPLSMVSSVNGGSVEAKVRAEKKVLEAKVKELEGQVEGLLEELDGKEEDDDDEDDENDDDSGVKKEFDEGRYKRRIADLEVALKREPQYLDVVNDLKVTKMALALANMEKEQALFALKKVEAEALRVEDVDSPVSAKSIFA